MERQAGHTLKCTNPNENEVLCYFNSHDNAIYGTYMYNFHLPHCYISVCSKYAIVYYMSKCLPQEKKIHKIKTIVAIQHLLS